MLIGKQEAYRLEEDKNSNYIIQVQIQLRAHLHRTPTIWKPRTLS